MTECVQMDCDTEDQSFDRKLMEQLQEYLFIKIYQSRKLFLQIYLYIEFIIF